MRFVCSSRSREFVPGLRSLPGVRDRRFWNALIGLRSAGRSFVAVIAGFAIVVSLMALIPQAALPAEDAIAEPAAETEAGVIAAGYKPNRMSMEQMVEKLWTGADTVWLLIKATVGLRVSAQEEIEGLDIHEHGNEAYHGFVMVRSE